MKISFVFCLPTAMMTLSMAAAQSMPPQGKGAPVTEKRATAPAPVPAAEAEDDPWEERKMQAREDVEYLGTLLKAKQAELREAELRNSAALAHKVDIDRQKQKGYASGFVINQSELSIAENQSQLETRR